MAKINKGGKVKFTGTLTIPAITISAKTLLSMARADRYELEEVIGNDTYLPTPEAMLANPAYMEHLQKAITKMLSGGGEISDLYEGGARQLTSKKIKTIFKAEVAQAAADKKKVDGERRAVLDGDSPNTMMLKVSKHDADRVKAFLNRNDMPFVQMAQASATK